MSKSPKLLLRRPTFPSDFRALFRAIARCAVASSFVAGCSSTNGDAPSPIDVALPHAGTGAPHDASTQRHDAQAIVTPSDASLGLPDVLQDPPDTGPGPELDAAAPVLPGDWVPLECESDSQWPIEATSLAMPIDSLTHYAKHLRREHDDDDAGTLAGELGLTERRIHGEHCSAASDQSACLGAVEAAIDSIECSANPCDPFMIATHGQGVTLIEDRAALSALLGTLDTEIEAAIAGLFAGAWVGCSHGLLPETTPPTGGGTRIRAIEGGYEIDTRSSCYGATRIGSATVAPDATVTILRNGGFCLGRRPEGLLAMLPVHARSELGAYFASAARLEAASVFAFERLARELGQLGAPSELIAGACRSALEEVGHAHTMAVLAERFGATPCPARIEAPAPRTLTALAVENAVEGCVRESFGALLACYQAEVALDPDVRAAMQQIAEDETRHAQLAWQLARFLEPRLTHDELAAVRAAQRAAYTQLAGELSQPLSPAAQRCLGLPDERTALALLAQLDAALGLTA